MGQIKCFLIEITNLWTEWKEDISTESGSREQLYRRVDNGDIGTINSFGVGAIWEATWFNGFKGYCGTDGKSYIVKTPGGDWMIDGRASNCTLPEDDEHKCWCRHGVAPDFTVDKNGLTCNAGAGSIAIGNYHGFLKNGYLVD